MSLYTHWACFECRKSFHNTPLPDSEKRNGRRCPDCGEQMRDMGIYFEPPRRQARKAWAIMRLLAESGYSFQREGDKSYIEHFILESKRPRTQDVIKKIEQEKQLTTYLREKNRLDEYKRGERFRKERGSANQK
jgi:DNA-directed RNA polymerase subunit RPC12/RpoP